MTKDGPGTLVLTSTANNFGSSYTSTLTGGILQIGDGLTSPGSFPGNLINTSSTANALTFAPPINTTLTLAGIFSGSGAVTQNGSGTTYLTGSNTYTGATTISAGTLSIGNGSTMGYITSSVISISPSAMLNFYPSGSLTITNTISGPSGSFLQFQGIGNNGSTGNITATGTTYSGFSGTVVANGSRVVLNSTTFSGSAAFAVSNSGEFDLNAGTFTNPITIAGPGWFDGSQYLGAIRFNGNTWSGPITLSANASLSAYRSSGLITGTITGPYQLDFVSGSAPAGDTMTLTPTAANTYGSTLVSSGITAVAGNSGAFSTGGLALAGGVLETNGFNFSFANLSGPSGTLGNYSAASSSTVTIGTDNSNTTYGGSVANGGAFSLAVVKTGTGALTLTGTGSSYSGGTTIQNGSIIVTSDAVSGPASLGTVPGSATPNNLVLNGGTLTAGSSLTLNANRGIGLGPTSGSVGGGGAIGVAAGASVTYNGVIATAGNTGANTLTLAGPGSLYLGGASTNTGTLNLSAGTVNVGGTLAFSTVNVNGGKLYLNNTNSATAINVARGATLGGTGSANSAAVGVANGGTLDFSPNTGSTFTAAGLSFGGSGTIYLNDAGGQYASAPAISVATLTTSSTINLNVSNVPAGTGTMEILQYGSIGGSGTGAFNLASPITVGRSTYALFNSGNTIDLSYFVDFPFWTGAGNLSWDTSSASNWALNSTSASTTFQTGDAVVFDDRAIALSGTTAQVVNITAANVSPSTVTFSNTAASYVINGPYGISDGTAVATSLVKYGAGSLTINNSNGYSGGTTLYAGLLNAAGTQALGIGTLVQSGGTLTLGAPQSVSSVSLYAGLLDINSPQALGSGTVAIASGTIDNTSGGPVRLTTGNPQYWNGNFAFGGSNPLDLGTGNVTLGGSETLNVSGSTLTVEGAISGPGDSLTLSGAGALVLLGSNSYSGPTIVSGGTLQIGNGGSGASIGSTTAVSLAANTALIFNHADAVNFSQIISGSGSVVQTGSGQLTFPGNQSYTGGTTIAGGTLQLGSGTAAGSVVGPITVNSGASLAYFRSDNSYSVTNAISGGGTIYVLGTGTSSQSAYQFGTLSAGFSGTVVVNNARLQNNSNGLYPLTNLGSPTMLTVIDNGADGGQVYDYSQTVNYPITIAGQGWQESAGRLGALRIEGATWAGSVTLSGSARIGSYGGFTNYITGQISGPYQLEFWGANGTPSYTLTPSSANTYGSTEVTVATVIAGNANAYSTGGLLMNSGILETKGFNFTFANIGGTAGSIGNYSTTTSSTITVGVDNSSTSYSGTLVNGSTQPLALDKIGSGTLTLGGVNTFTGGATINAGTLLLGNASALGAANVVTVNSGTLNVNGLSPTTGYLAGSGPVINNTNSSGILLALGSTTQTFSGSLSGALYVNGANGGGGQQVLAPANPITLSTLQDGATSSSDTASLAISGGSTTVTGDVQIGNGGVGYFTMSGGTLTAKGSNFILSNGGQYASYTQTGGLVNVNVSGFFGTGNEGGTSSMTISGGSLISTFGMNHGVRGSASLTISGSGYMSVPTITYAHPSTSGGTATIINLDGGMLNVGSIALAKTSVTGYFDFDGGVLQARTSGGTLMGGLTTALVQAGGAIIDTQAFSTTVSQQLSHDPSLGSTPDGGLQKIGAGLLNLAGYNTYTGNTTVSAGTLQLGNNFALGSGGLVANAGVVDLNNQQFVSIAALSGSGGVVTDNSAATANVLTVSQASNTTFSGTILNGPTVSLGLNLSGPGLLNLGGTNAYTGGTVVSAGTLQLGNNSALGSGGLIANGGGVDLNGYNPTINGLGGASGLITNNSSSAATLTVSQTGTTAFYGTFHDGAAPVGLTVAAGALTLYGNNTHSGPTTVSGGALIAGAANTLSPNSTVTLSSGLLDVTAGSQSLAGFTMTGGTLNLNLGNLLSVAGGTAALSGALNIQGTPSGSIVDLMSYPHYTGSFSTSTPEAGYNLVYTPTELELVQAVTGPATWNVATSGSWTVGTNWSSGTSPTGVGVMAVLGTATTSPTTISLDSPQTLGTLTFANSAASYTLTPGAAGSLTLDNTGGTIGGQIIVLSGTHSIAAPLIISSSAAYVSITSGGSLDISGNISEANGSHSLSLSSSDATGVLSLDGSNSFSGGVYVNSGTLILNGAASLAPGSALTIGTTSPPSTPSVLASPAEVPSVSLAPVPEPGTLTLFVIAVLFSTVACYRFSKKAGNSERPNIFQ
jgi:autotransporter-associated beta strand protein